MLIGFSLAYYVLYHDYVDEDGEKPYGTVSSATAVLFTSFLGEVHATQTAMDVIFGILSILILLNVVIAIVNTAWVKAIRTSALVFVRFRAEFLEESKTLPFAHFEAVQCKPYYREFLRIRRGKEKDDDSDEKVLKFHEDYSDQLEIPDYLEWRAYVDPPDTAVYLQAGGIWLIWWHWQLTYIVLHSFFVFIVGPVTLGFFWPLSVRKFIFGSRIKFPSDTIDLVHEHTREMRQNWQENAKEMSDMIIGLEKQVQEDNWKLEVQMQEKI